MLPAQTTEKMEKVSESVVPFGAYIHIGARRPTSFSLAESFWCFGSSPFLLVNIPWLISFTASCGSPILNVCCYRSISQRSTLFLLMNFMSSIYLHFFNSQMHRNILKKWPVPQHLNEDKSTSFSTDKWCCRRETHGSNPINYSYILHRPYQVVSQLSYLGPNLNSELNITYPDKGHIYIYILHIYMYIYICAYVNIYIYCIYIYMGKL